MSLRLTYLVRGVVIIRNVLAREAKKPYDSAIQEFEAKE